MPPSASEKAPRQHGVKGVYYGGEWLDIEDCAGKFNPENCSSCNHKDKCPRSRSRRVQSKEPNGAAYDVVIVGAGCVGAAIARELSKYSLAILWLEAADDGMSRVLQDILQVPCVVLSIRLTFWSV